MVYFKAICIILWLQSVWITNHCSTLYLSLLPKLIHCQHNVLTQTQLWSHLWCVLNLSMTTYYKYNKMEPPSREYDTLNYPAAMYLPIKSPSHPTNICFTWSKSFDFAFHVTSNTVSMQCDQTFFTGFPWIQNSLEL